MKDTLYIIAGEASGDQIGGMLLDALHAKAPMAKFHGIGGFSMMQRGFSSLFPMRELSLMGFIEILPHIVRLKKRITQTVRDIESKKPAVLVTIDSPGFNFRVIEMLKKRRIHVPYCVHYVAPTVWAYKPERAQKIATLVNELLCILPFEPNYFTSAGLRSHYVGHPIAWWWKHQAASASFRLQHNITADQHVIALFPGSRSSELMRHLPIMREAIALLHQRIPNLSCAMLVREDMRSLIDPFIISWPCPLYISANSLEKTSLFAGSNAAIAKSGTIALECALAGLPSVTIYKTSAATAWYMRKKLKIAYVNIANILAGRMVIPELLQDACTPDAIASAIDALLHNHQEQPEALAHIANVLGANDVPSPSEKAAEYILAVTKR
jgi:lipid-A-disaccharide synthase